MSIRPEDPDDRGPAPAPVPASDVPAPLGDRADVPGEEAGGHLANSMAWREAQPIVEQLPFGIFRKDATGRFIFVNPRFCQLKATAAAHILGRTVTEIAAEESRNPESRWQPDLAAQESLHHRLVMQAGRQVEREETYRCADQQALYFQVVESPVRADADTIVGSQGFLFDITSRKQSDLALARDRDLLGALLENSLDYIYFKDLDSRFIKCSNGLAIQLGTGIPDGLLGKSDFDIFSEEHARPAFEDEQEIIRTGQPMIGKVERETWIDGRPDTWALTSKLPLRNSEGKIIGTFGITKDITALKKAEQRIDEVHEQLVKASRLAGMAEIATNVLHNVGNVLNSVNVSADLLGRRLRSSKVKGLARAVQLMDAHPDDLGEFLANDARGKLLPAYLRELAQALEGEHAAMAEELDVLGRSVDHIKEVVATQQSYAGASRVVELVEIDKLLDDALRMNAAALTRHNVDVVKNLDELPVLPLDRHRLLQILVNLISNAKHAMNGAPERIPCITLGAALVDSAPGRVLRITVADNGEGIAPENLTRVFAHGFTTRKDGHGFGLHSCILAAQELGGSLTAHSDGIGQGATFLLEIPIDAPKDLR
jgi:PAS domain S-box-containing protein